MSTSPTARVMTLQQALASLGLNHPDRIEALQVLGKELLGSPGAPTRWQKLAAKTFDAHYSLQERFDRADEIIGDLMLRFANSADGYTTDNAKAYLRQCIVHEARRASMKEARHQRNRDVGGTSDEGEHIDPLERLSYEDAQTPEERAVLILGEHPNLGEVAKTNGVEGIDGWVSALLKERVIPLLTRSDTRENTTSALDVMLEIHSADATQHSIVLKNHPGWTTAHPEFDKELNTLQQQCSRARKYLTRELSKLTHTELGITEAELDFVYAFIASL